MRKNLIFSCAMVLLATLFIAVMPTEAEGAVYEDTVRLHILANSDSREDQAIKLAVRDAVLSEYGAMLAEFDCAASAEAELMGMTDEISDFCRGVVQDMGYEHDVSVTVGKEWYETREYDDFSLPAGVYTSLQIFIGEGSGQNWWCVMFPPMCVDIATENAPADTAVQKYTDEELVLISGGGYKAKFKILELISSAFS